MRGRNTVVIYRPVAEAEPSAKGKKSKDKSASNAKSQANKGSGSRRYTVRPGDTLYSIASAHGTSAAALRRDNHKAAEVLRPGDVLVIK